MRKHLHFAAALVAAGSFVFLNGPVLAQDQYKDKDKTSTSPTDKHKTSTPSDETSKTTTTTSSTSTSGTSVSSADRAFAMKAAEANLAEVELGKLAQQKASSDDVKNFANRMVDDHQKANDELKQWAETKSVTLPADLNSKDKALKDRLSNLSGSDFDKAYIRDMVKDHKKDVAEFQRESNRASDPELKSWASKTLPTLQDHLKMAEDVNSKTAGIRGKRHERSRSGEVTTTDQTTKDKDKDKTNK